MTALAALRYLVAELEYHRDNPTCKFDPEALIVASGARDAIQDEEDFTAEIEAAFVQLGGEG